MKLSRIITDDHPAAYYVIVLDKDGNEVPKVKSYNMDTGEAEVYVIGQDGKIQKELIDPKVPGVYRWITKKLILEGSKISFRCCPTYFADRT